MFVGENTNKKDWQDKGLDSQLFPPKPDKDNVRAPSCPN